MANCLRPQITLVSFLCSVLLFYSLGSFLLDSKAEAGIFGKNSLDDHSLVACPFLIGVDDTDTKSLLLGAGYGYDYGDIEIQNFLYGYHNSWNICFGGYLGFEDNGDVSLFSSNDNEVEAGSMLGGSYHPWGFSLLPQGKLTPLALVGIPALYFEAGASAYLLNGKTSCNTVTTATETGAEADVNCSEENKFRLVFMPEIVAGAELRLIAIKLFAEYRYGFSLALPGGAGAGLSALVGLGVFW